MKEREDKPKKERGRKGDNRWPKKREIRGRGRRKKERKGYMKEREEK